MCKNGKNDKKGDIEVKTGFIAGGLRRTAAVWRCFMVCLKWLKRCVWRRSVKELRVSIHVDCSQAFSQITTVSACVEKLCKQIKEVNASQMAGTTPAEDESEILRDNPYPGDLKSEGILKSKTTIHDTDISFELTDHACRGQRVQVYRETDSRSGVSKFYAIPVQNIFAKSFSEFQNEILKKMWGGLDPSKDTPAADDWDIYGEEFLKVDTSGNIQKVSPESVSSAENVEKLQSFPAAESVSKVAS